MGFMATIKAQQAMRAHGKGDLEQAKKLYEEAIDKGLMSARPMLGYAILLIREGSYDKAMPLLIKAQKCPDLTPDQKSQLFVDYAACLMKKGELDKAIHLLEKQHNRAPIGLTYQTLGYMYVEKYSGAKPVAEAAPEKAAEALEMPDAAAESNMITAIVQALTEFPTVEKVEFLVGGQKLETLPHGTSVSGQFTREDLNLEMASADIALEDAEPVTLYFPGDAGNVLVPVTRMVYSEPDINTAVVELCKGPSAASPLESVLPAGCGVIDVSVEDGVAKINFTGEFIELAENSDGGRLALKALVLTCTQFEGIEGVEIYVDGEPYDPGADTLALPACANVAEEIVDSAIQTQSSLIFEFE